MSTTELPPISGGNPDDCNQCELRCPAKRVAGWIMGELMPNLPLVQRPLVFGLVGVKGLELMMRANTSCPSRNMPKEEWCPTVRCGDEARNFLERVGEWKQPVPSDLVLGVQAEVPEVLEGLKLEIEPPRP